MVIIKDDHSDDVSDEVSITIHVYSLAVNGGWSSWTSGTCSAKCGSGLKTLTRQCNRPAQAFGGRKCLGSGSMTRPCKIMECLSKCFHLT